jgi:hypothetical protein
MRARTVQPGERVHPPGPGAYTSNMDKYLQGSPNCKIGTSKREGLVNASNVPGPGTYNGARANSVQNGPKYGFGTSKRVGIDDLSKTAPGPGAYNLGVGMKATGGGATIVPRRPISGSENVKAPGPGAYEPKLNGRNSSPSYKMGSAQRSYDEREQKSKPGPGQYEIKNAHSGAPSYKIGSSQRQDISQSGVGPGPGAYSYNSRAIEGPKHVMTARHEDTSLNYLKSTPGPGAYTPAFDKSKDRSPAVGIGTSARSDLAGLKVVPGPGQYDVRGRLGGPKWGFGAEERAGITNSPHGQPGPGHYNLPSKFADLPKYALGNSPLKIHP